MTETELAALIREHGLLIIAPIALVEGPIVSVATGYLVKLDLINLWPALAVLVLADLVGDAIVYALGRWGRPYVPLDRLTRLGVTRRRLARVLRAFHRKGGRILVFGKLTHVAGFTVLLAAGIARMPLPRFLALNLLATLPKAAVLVTLGWWFGRISAATGHWVTAGAILIVASACAALSIQFILRQRSQE